MNRTDALQLTLTEMGSTGAGFNLQIFENFLRQKELDEDQEFKNNEAISEACADFLEGQVNDGILDTKDNGGTFTFVEAPDTANLVPDETAQTDFKPITTATPLTVKELRAFGIDDSEQEDSDEPVEEELIIEENELDELSEENDEEPAEDDLDLSTLGLDDDEESGEPVEDDVDLSTLGLDDDEDEGEEEPEFVDDEPKPEPVKVELVDGKKQIEREIPHTNRTNQTGFDDSAPSTPTTPNKIVAVKGIGGCDFPTWLKWLLGLGVPLLIALALWALFHSPTAKIDPTAIQTAIDDSTTGLKVDLIEETLLGDNENDLGLVGAVNEINEKLDNLMDPEEGVIATVNNLTVIVNEQNTQLNRIEETVNKNNIAIGEMAADKLSDGKKVSWFSPEFGLNQPKLSKENEAKLIAEVIPQIKVAIKANANKGLVIRVIGKVDRSSVKADMKGQRRIGLARASYVTSLLKKEGIKVIYQSWGVNYNNDHRIVEVVLEPPK